MSGIIPKRYLGDGTYVEIEGGMFKLTTSDGLQDTATIYLEPDVYEAFARFTADALQAYRRLEEIKRIAGELSDV